MTAQKEILKKTPPLMPMDSQNSRGSYYHLPANGEKLNPRATK